MEHVAPSVTNRDGSKSSRTHSRSNSDDAQAYAYAGPGDGRTGSNSSDRIEARAVDDLSGYYANKKPRLDIIQNNRQQQAYESPYSSLTPSSIRPQVSASDRPGPSLGEHGGNSGYTTSRFVENATQRFPASILQAPVPFSPSSDGLPSAWGPQTRSASFPSPPLISPLGGSPYSRRESSFSAGVQGVPSPGTSSNSSIREDGRSQYPASLHGQSPALYPGGTPTFPLQHYGGSTGGTAAPLPPARYGPSVEAYGSSAAQYQQSHAAYSGTGYQHAPQIPAQTAAQGSFLTAQDRAPHYGQADTRPYQQAAGYSEYPRPQSNRTDQAPSTAVGGWTQYLDDGALSTDLQVATRPRPAVPAPTPAAPLQSILHPVNRTPLLRPAEIPNLLGNEIQIAPDAMVLASTSNGGRPERRQRSTFTLEQRNETSQTRAVGACLRCKSQRVRCIPSPLGPFSMCLTCEQVSRNSKKVLHEIRCVRWRLVAMTIYRSGGLNLTQRWDGTVIKDIGDWVGHESREIEMKLFYTSHMHRYDLCNVPVKLRVRRFTPAADDVLTRKWIKRIVTEDGVTRTERRFIQLPAYALADVNETVETLRDYFNQNALRTMYDASQFALPVIRQHFEAAIRHYQSLPDGDVEKRFLEKFFKLWFYIRFTTGSSYISGPDKLDCAPVNDPDYPLGDRISVPRMITAQCDSIMVSRFLRPLSQELIPEFEKFFRTGNPDNWFTLYICTFILLEEVSFSCQDRRRHAKENWITDVKYTVSEFVGELQFGANIILCHWHYYRTMDPLDDGWEIFCQIIEPRPRPRLQIESAKGKGKKKVHITRGQCDLITQHWRDMIEIAAMLDTKHYRECYEHPLYFVCQMYLRGWMIRETYKREIEVEELQEGDW